MRHSNSYPPVRDPHYLQFFFHVICCRESQKNTIHEGLYFLKNFLVDLDKILTVNIPCNRIKFSSHRQKWAQLWFGRYEKIKIKNNLTNQKNENY